jgi:hypothetical protein
LSSNPLFFNCSKSIFESDIMSKNFYVILFSFPSLILAPKNPYPFAIPNDSKTRNFNELL